MDFRLTAPATGSMFAISGWTQTASDTLPRTGGRRPTRAFEALIEEGEPEVGETYRFERDGEEVTVRVTAVDDDDAGRQRVRGDIVGD